MMGALFCLYSGLLIHLFFFLCAGYHLEPCFYPLKLSGCFEYTLTTRAPELDFCLRLLADIFGIDKGAERGERIEITLAADASADAGRRGGVAVYPGDLAGLQSADAFERRMYLAVVGMRLHAALMCKIQERGGFFVHGGLVKWQDRGVILAGKSGVGKSTACARLAPPWQALCDDTTLVLPSAEGGFWAHPWPTWSRFSFDGQGGSWNVEQAVPLAAICLMHRAGIDEIAPVGQAEAFVGLLQANDQLNGVFQHDMYRETTGPMRKQILTTAGEIARRVPVFRLGFTLNGAFWETIESYLRLAQQSG
jgi:hypothetical protein